MVYCEMVLYDLNTTGLKVIKERKRNRERKGQGKRKRQRDREKRERENKGTFSIKSLKNCCIKSGAPTNAIPLFHSQV